MEKFLSLKKKIKKNEGFRNKPYLDTLGYSTIGYGHLITNKEKKMFKAKFSKKFNELVSRIIQKIVKGIENSPKNILFFGIYELH